MIRITVSDLIYSQGCRRQFRWGKQWRPKYPVPALWLGTAVHEGLDGYYSSDRSPENMMSSFRAWAEKSLSSKRLPGMLRRAIQSGLVPLGESMLKSYTEYDRRFPLEGEVVDVERLIELPVGDQFVLVGRLDLVLRTPQGLVIVDHKTSRSGSPKDTKLDLQLDAYSYMASRVYGEAPVRIIHNTLRKARVEKPHLIRNGKALSKAKSLITTPGLYREAIEESGFDESDYSNFLVWLEQHWWQNLVVRTSFSAHPDEKFLKFLDARLSLITELLADEARAFPIYSENSCRFCEFRRACLAEGVLSIDEALGPSHRPVVPRSS